MTALRDTLHVDLAAIVGADHVRAATHDDAIDGVVPRLVVAPGSAEDVAAVLRLANEAGLAVAPRGGGTKTGWGNPPSSLDLVLSMRRLSGVVEHAWGDMTATVQAGCAVADLQRALAEHGQQLVLDALWPERSTIGGLIATNDSGALRVRFGGVRDLILGVTVVLPDGTIARSGGRVVKNVAGYDLPKLMTGALGTLGVITEATFRLYPLPAERRTLSVAAPSIAAANDAMLRMLDSTLVPTGLQLRMSHDSPPRIDVRFEGIADAIATQVDHLRRIVVDESGLAHVDDADESVWGARESLWDDSPASAIARISVLLADWSAMVAAVSRVAPPLRLTWSLVAQAIGLGTMRIDAPNDEALLAGLTLLRGEAKRLRGSLVAQRIPLSIKSRFDVWGAAGDSLPLQRRIRDQFDPNAILNPGRFIRF
jgi:glycolate oxidase FAD binding subunit